MEVEAVMTSPVKDRMWYSAMAVFVVRIGDSSKGHIQRSVYLVRATDFDDALSTVIARARRDEEAYKNCDDEWVRWMLADIETLDQLGDGIEDGREVYSEPRFDIPLDSYAFPFKPENAKPTYSGV